MSSPFSPASISTTPSICIIEISSRPSCFNSTRITKGTSPWITSAAKLIGAGLATIALAGVGIGIGNILGSFIFGCVAQPSRGPEGVRQRTARLRADRGDRAVRLRRRDAHPVRVLRQLQNAKTSAMQLWKTFGGSARRASGARCCRSGARRRRRDAAAQLPRLPASARLARDFLRRAVRADGARGAAKGE